MKALVELYTNSRFKTQTLKSSTTSCCLQKQLKLFIPIFFENRRQLLSKNFRAKCESVFVLTQENSYSMGV